MAKRGYRPRTFNGEPKKRVTIAFSTDVIEYMKTKQPGMAVWLEVLIRKEMIETED